MATTTAITHKFLARTASLALFVINTLLLLVYHAHANSPTNNSSSSSSNNEQASSSNNSNNNNNMLWQRLWTGGPANLDQPLDKVLMAALVTAGFELLDFVAKHWGPLWHAKPIPVRGKHLDVLSAKDLLFIGFSKANTAPFTYFYFRYVFEATDDKIVWKLSDVTFMNTIVALILLFVVFDFVYTLLHWFLHKQAIYGYIHKHHHHQKAPSRATVDAINVHPIEYLLGEYNHILSLYVCTTWLLPVPIHFSTTVAFLIVGGMLAALNHTRYDFVVSLPGINLKLYDSKAHDVHHRIPNSNYGQYTMLWDVVFGNYRYV